jgi:glycosyltransferase involved in cell wall biosynthesis
LRVAYVVKRYPRYSETFVVTEILAHEAAGLEIEIFSLYPPNDDHYQDAIARVRAPVKYLYPPGISSTPDPVTPDAIRAADLWQAIGESAPVLPGFWSALEKARGAQAFDVYQAVLLAREVRLRGIEHVHAHFASAATTVARLAAGFAGVPYTFTAHAKDIFHQSVSADELQRKITDAAAVITVSDYNSSYLRQNDGGSHDKVQRVYNGLALEQFLFESPDERPRVVISVGRLVEKKGLSDLVEACAILAARGCEFSCQIVGTGPQEQQIRTQIYGLGLHERVKLVGPRPQGEVIKLVQQAAVVAAPYVVGSDGNRDGLPTALLEAMALGTPCVATDVTGVPEAVRHEETGLIVPQHDPRALANSIERLLDDRALRVRLAARARELVEAEFDICRNSARLREIFRVCQMPARGGSSSASEAA